MATALDQRFTIQAYLKAERLPDRASSASTSTPGTASGTRRRSTTWAIGTAGYSPFRVNENGTVKTVTQYATSYIRDNAVRFIQESENQDATPWFLEVTTTAPHSPFIPEAAVRECERAALQPDARELRDRQARQAAACPGRGRCDIDGRARSERANQLRTLMSVDDMVQTVFQTLEATGEASNTLAIFMSDNGFMWGEHGLRAKGDAYDASVRVPMYMRWPGHVIAGATDNRLVANIDVAPDDRGRPWAGSPRGSRWTAARCWTRCRAARAC